MKYVLKNDIRNLFSKNLFIIETFIFIIICFPIISKMAGYNFDKEILYMCNGISNNFSTNIIAGLLFVMNIAFYLYITIYLFTFDIKNGIDNLFARIKPNKWIKYKLISITIILTIIKTLLFLITVLNNTDLLDNVYTIFFNQFLAIILLNYIVIYTYIWIVNSNKILTIFNILLIIVYFIIYNYLVFKINIVVIVILITIYFILIERLFKKKYMGVFQNV